MCRIALRTNNFGIKLEFLGFKKIGLPENVTQTVFDRMKNERQSRCCFVAFLVLLPSQAFVRAKLQAQNNLAKPPRVNAKRARPVEGLRVVPALAAPCDDRVKRVGRRKRHAAA